MCEERSFLAEFVKNQAIGYRYSQLFAWKEGNANRFFGLFGSDFKEYMKTEIDADNNLKKSIEAFVELGRLRNQAIHENLITFSLIKSTNEIFDRYDEAKLFVEKFPTIVSRYIEQSKT